MAKTVSRGVDLEPIDRLEEKIRMLVSTLERLKTEHTRVADENARLQRDIAAARARLADAVASHAGRRRSEARPVRHTSTCSSSWRRSSDRGVIQTAAGSP
jgi:regulator of replication initiation timing